METGAQKLEIGAAAWSEEFGQLLAGCFVAPGEFEAVQGEVESGEAALFAVRSNSETVAAFVLRVDGREGVIVAASGPAKLVASLVPDMARRFSGVRRVRIHTTRPAVAHMLLAQGFGAVELVLKKEVM